jgi:hypothetical protein
MSDAAQYREKVARIHRLLNASTDQLTRERLTALAEEYLAKASALDAGTPRASS